MIWLVPKKQNKKRLHPEKRQRKKKLMNEFRAQPMNLLHIYCAKER